MKATLKIEETPNCIATSLSGKIELTVCHGVKYDFMYDNEDNFYLIVDDIIYQDNSTSFDFIED